ncbi:MAG TPA: S9 family peptidase [Thermoanaerobaculia bacterium]|jgi:dipeptidyl aminopeptidase/acylaminoacyl peptidase
MVPSHRFDLASLALVFAAPVFAAPAGRPSKQYAIERFLATTSISGASFSADEKKILFSSNKTGIYNVYSIAVTGGEPAALTSSTTDTTLAVGYFPKDDRFLYTRDKGGDEKNHLFVRERDGSEKDLTPGENLKAIFAGWTHVGDAFYLQTNERDPRFFDLYRYHTNGYARKLFYTNEAGYQVGDVSHDGRWVALAKSRTTADSDISLWNAATNETKLISKHEGIAEYVPGAFDPDSKALYYTTNDGSEFSRVKRYDLATGRHEEIERADWDVFLTSFSHNGRYRLTAVNEDGRTVLRIHDGKTERLVTVPNLPAGEIGAVRISRSETKLAFQLNGDRAPNNLYVFEFGGKAPRRLTDTLSKDIDPEDLVEAQVVRFPSFDGMAIPNIFYKPHEASSQAKAPALVWVHGGPGGQTRRSYSPYIQFLVNHGYVVLGINNRGSSGYGKTFYTADDRKHGHEPLSDCVAARKYLQSLPYVDPDRIGILGGSYGGYMTLTALTLQPDVFAVGIDLFGISNWVRTLESIPKWWESQREALYQEIGDPVKDREMLLAVSPLFHADKIKKPLMVLQGANDPRVIKPESDDIVAAARKNGVAVEYIVFPDEGHGFTKKKNQIEGWKSILEFLEKHLKGAPAAPAKAA